MSLNTSGYLSELTLKYASSSLNFSGSDAEAEADDSTADENENPNENNSNDSIEFQSSPPSHQHRNANSAASESALASLRSSHSALELHYSQERNELQTKIRSLEAQVTDQLAESTQEINLLSRELAQLQAELAKERQMNEARKGSNELSSSSSGQVEYLKGELDSGLAITESIYLDYQEIPYENLSVKQFAAMKVFELLKAERGSKEKLRLDCQVARESELNMEIELTRVTRELELIKKSRYNRENDLSDRLEIAEKQLKHAREELNNKTLEQTDFLHKLARFDQLSTELERVEQENRSLKQNSLVANSNLKSVLDEKSALFAGNQESARVAEMLRMDKIYLEKEIEHLKSQLKSAELKCEKNYSKISELKQLNGNLQEKLIKVQEENKNYYSDKFHAEYNKTIEEMKKEFFEVKQTNENNFTKEIKWLNNAIEELRMNLLRTQQESQSFKELHAMANEENKKLIIQLEFERMENSNSNKLKDFEYEKLGLLMEENLSELKKARLSNEMNESKVAVLQKELNSVVHDRERESIRFEHEISNLKEKLSIYHQLEMELDLAIMKSGNEAVKRTVADKIAGINQTDSDESDGQHNLVGIHRILDSVGGSMPIANKRRLKQSLILAQQLVEKQNQINELHVRTESLKNSNDLLSRELSVCRSQLSSIHQPQQYLIHSIGEKENKINELESEIQRLMAELDQERKKLEKSIEIRIRMEDDLRRMLGQRSELEKIRLIVKQQTENSNNQSPNYFTRCEPKSLGKENELPAEKHKETDSNALPQSREFSASIPLSSNSSSSAGARFHSIGIEGEGALAPIWFRKLKK